MSHCLSLSAQKSSQPLAAQVVNSFGDLLETQDAHLPQGIVRDFNPATDRPFLYGEFGYVTSDRKTAEALLESTSAYLLVAKGPEPTGPAIYAIATAAEAKAHWGRSEERLAQIDAALGNEAYLF